MHPELPFPFPGPNPMAMGMPVVIQAGPPTEYYLVTIAETFGTEPAITYRLVKKTPTDILDNLIDDCMITIRHDLSENDLLFAGRNRWKREDGSYSIMATSTQRLDQASFTMLQCLGFQVYSQ